MFRLHIYFGWLCLVQLAGAAEFSVVTKLYSGEDERPVSEHRILFTEGTAYHFSAAGQPLAVYQSDPGKVTLLDLGEEVQTEIRLDDLLSVTAAAKAAVEDPAQRQQLGITADVVADEDAYRVEFAGIGYRAETQLPQDPAMASDYGRFADLALRMNILRPVGPPPFARLKLNRQLVARGRIPVASTMTITRGGRMVEFRSTNQFGELNEDDRRRVQQAQTLLREYRQIPLSEFPQPPLDKEAGGPERNHQ